MASYIGLNVGGKIYMTSRMTLTCDPGCFFARMLDESIPSARDKHGNYMIDRDGEMFRHVLNFMRCGKLQLPEGFRELSLLECEADFYQLGALQASIRQLNKLADEFIGFNVGGKIFKTTRETLARAPDSRFTDILFGEVQLPPKDEQGNYMFDRSSEMFEYVLEFLRCGHLALSWRSSGWDLLLADEAEFFRMPRLLAHIKSVWDLANPARSACLYVFHDQSRDQYTVNFKKWSKDYTKGFFPFIFDPTYNSCLVLHRIGLINLPDLPEDEKIDEIGTVSFKLGSRLEQHNNLPNNADELVSYIDGRMSRTWSLGLDERVDHVDEHYVQYRFLGYVKIDNNYT